jgi:hypothetical protein
LSSLDGSRIPLFYGEVEIDANDKYHPITHTRPSEGYLEFFGGVDPMQSPPYMLPLMGDMAGSCSIFNPAEGWLIKGCGDYEEARL